MTLQKNKKENTTDREIMLTRIIDAPRERVYEAMTNPDQVVKWWGPFGFTTTNHEMDVRPGGVWRRTLHGPDGKDYINKSIYDEIIPNEKVSFTHAGGEVGSKDRSTCFQGVWIFEKEGKNKTKLTMKIVFQTPEARDECVEKFGAVEGGKQTLSRLREFVAGGTVEPFVICRTFNAPREKVWKAWTQREEMAKWWGPKGFSVQTGEMDFRPGGTYHYCMKSPGGEPLWGKMFYREISEPSLLIFVNCFSDENGGITRHPYSSDPWPLEMLSTITFEEEKGKTKLTVKWVPINPTPEEAASFNAGRSSMTQGWTGTLEQFSGYVEK
jgi:uncharacterized protein YndB with AHSA1/START domain